MSQLRHLFVAVILTALVGGLGVPAPVSAVALPPHDETRPDVMRQAAAEVARATPGPAPTAPPKAASPHGGAAARPAREVFGFADAGSLGDARVGYPSWDFSQLSTVAYFGLSVAPTGDIIHDGGWNVMNSATFSGFRDTAHGGFAKVVLTLILQNLGTDMCNGLSNRQTTVNQAIPLLTSMNVDGFNIDYEGTYQTCANGQTNQSMLVDLAAKLRAAMPAGRNYLSIDTYASSAADTSSCNCGFFDVRALNSYVDSFFVMEYALESSNWSRAPLNCSSFCLSPTSPLAGYYWNDTTTNQQYAGLVGAGKVIMGVPYYGDKACVSGPSPNGVSTGQYATSGYDYNKSIPGQSTVTQYSTHRDAHDPAGNERWDSYYFNDPTAFTCWRELYWDDTASLAAKYQLVLNQGLRGVGLWNLNLGGGTGDSPELWTTLAQYFNCPASVSVAASQASTSFAVNLSAPCAATYDVMEQDVTLHQGYLPAGSTGGSSLTVNTFAGHTYNFEARTHSAAGISGWSPPASTTVAAGATNPHPFGALYTLDGYGGVQPADSEPLAMSAYWPGWDIARSIKSVPGGQGGVVLDGWGGLHGYGSVTSVRWSAYWPGWNIARDLAILPSGTGGYVLDGWGGLHPFSINGNPLPPDASWSAYWPGWDIARKLVLFPDGTGGYVLDGWGALHSFSVGGAARAPDPAPSAYWPGWDIARAVALVPGTRSGYVLDGWGGLHEFGGAAAVRPPAYWPGWDIARGLLIYGGTPSQPAGYSLDGWGGLHPFGGAPGIAQQAYWPGWDIARGITSG